MEITNARFTNAAHSSISADIDGVAAHIPVSAGNRHYDEIVKQKITPAAYAPPPPTADHVRVEARRRMIALTGARDATHLHVRISNQSRDMIRLILKGRENWSAKEAARAAELAQTDAAIEAIRAAGNALEGAPPDNYADDEHWP